MKKRIIKEKQRKKKFFIAALPVLISAFLIFNIIISDTVYLQEQTYTQSEDGLFYIFKNEDYRVINSSSPINFIYKEGEKINANSILAEKANIDLSEYISIKIRSIDILIDNSELYDKADIYALMAHTKTQLDIIDQHLTQAIKENNEEAKITLADQRETKQLEYEILKTSLSFVHLSNSDLISKRKELNTLLNKKKYTLTPYNLNFSVYGNVYYSLDGYENYLNLDNLDKISNSFFSTVDKIVYNYNHQENEYHIKSTATDKIIICAKVPAELYIEAEYDATSMTEWVYTQYDISEGFYNFLYRQISILNLYPSVSFIDKEENMVCAKLLNVVYDNEFKYLVMCVRDNFSYFMQRRIFTADIITEEYNCYILPSSTITETNGVFYITVKDELNNNQNIEVKIYKKTASKVYLKIKSNPLLGSYEEVLRRGKKL